jgi:hypothetical protein
MILGLVHGMQLSVPTPILRSTSGALLRIPVSSDPGIGTAKAAFVDSLH